MCYQKELNRIKEQQDMLDYIDSTSLPINSTPNVVGSKMWQGREITTYKFPGFEGLLHAVCSHIYKDRHPVTNESLDAE